MSDRVRIAVVLAPARLYAWELAMLERLDALAGVELRVVEVAADEGDGSAAYRLFERLESRVFGMFDDPLARVPMPQQRSSLRSSDAGRQAAGSRR
jgi:hypothetical protein